MLCLGAHSDDIEIGCGGLILSLLKRVDLLTFDGACFRRRRGRDREAKRGAALFLKGARRKRVTLHQFRDGFFPYDGRNQGGIRVAETLRPDLVLTHYRDDRHQDHRVLSDLAWNTFRDHLVLEYEIPKYDGDLGTPNCFVPLTRRTAVRKVKYLNEAFGSQRDKHWFSAETFWD